MDVNWKIFWPHLHQERVGIYLLSLLCIQMEDPITEQPMDLSKHLSLGYLNGMILTCLLPVEQHQDRALLTQLKGIMSLLNLALNGEALERSEMSTDNEVILKRCNSMADIREVASKNSALKEAFVSSTNSVTDLVVSRFNSLCLKDESFCAMSSFVDEDELDRLFSFAKLIDPEISREKTTKKDLSSATKYYNRVFISRLSCREFPSQLISQ